MELSELVRKRRQELGLSQVELGIRADVAQRTVSELERGVRKRPNVGTLRQLAGALQLDLGDLVLAARQASSKADAERVADEVLQEDAVLNALLWELRDMDEHGRKMVLEEARKVRRWQLETERRLGGDRGMGRGDDR